MVKISSVTSCKLAHHHTSAVGSVCVVSAVVASATRKSADHMSTCSSVSVSADASCSPCLATFLSSLGRDPAAAAAIVASPACHCHQVAPLRPSYPALPERQDIEWNYNVFRRMIMLGCNTDSLSQTKAVKYLLSLLFFRSEVYCFQVQDNYNYVLKNQTL